MPAPNAVFRALADPTRRAILKTLRDGPRRAGDLAAGFPFAWATVSRHLAVLRSAGLVLAEREGTVIRYQLNTTVFQELLEHLLDLVRLERTPSHDKSAHSPRHRRGIRARPGRSFPTPRLDHA